MGLGKTVEMCRVTGLGRAARARRPCTHQRREHHSACLTTTPSAPAARRARRCALILANPFTPAASAAGRKMLTHSIACRPTKATLIVVPVVLLQQWEGEIRKCAGTRLAIHVHHGGDVMRKQGIKDTTPLQSADIVLTTYEGARLVMGLGS
jgi:hypothetical protein